MVKPVRYPIKPKSVCSKRIKKRRTKTVSSNLPNSSRNGLLSAEELQEIQRLSQILPNKMRANDPLRLIHNATHYINALTSTLMARVQNGSLPLEVLSTLPPSVVDTARQHQKSHKTTRRPN